MYKRKIAHNDKTLYENDDALLKICCHLLYQNLIKMCWRRLTNLTYFWPQDIDSAM